MGSLINGECLSIVLRSVYIITWARIACVASVSVWFWSKERPRNGILGFGRARNETRAILDSRSSFLVLNCTETLATQPRARTEFVIIELSKILSV